MGFIISDTKVNRIIDISKKAYEYSGRRVIRITQAGVLNVITRAMNDPLSHKKNLANLEMFKFRDTLVILCQMNLDKKPHLFWQGALDMRNGQLTEVPVGKRLVVTR